MFLKCNNTREFEHSSSITLQIKLKLYPETERLDVYTCKYGSTMQYGS